MLGLPSRPNLSHRACRYVPLARISHQFRETGWLGARDQISWVLGVIASRVGCREAEIALGAVAGPGRDVFDLFLGKPRLPPLSRPVCLQCYLKSPRRFQQRCGSPRSR